MTIGLDQGLCNSSTQAFSSPLPVPPSIVPLGGGGLDVVGDDRGAPWYLRENIAVWVHEFLEVLVLDGGQIRNSADSWGMGENSS